MKYRYASDCHNHSNCSFDGNSPLEEMCRRAQELELAYYTVTDHCECNEYRSSPYYSTGYDKVVRRAWTEMEAAQRAFPSLKLLRGIELGQPLQDLEAAEDALKGRDYDFVIGSVHNIQGFEDFYFLDYSQVSEAYLQELFATYLRELRETVEWGKFDALGHLTYPLRYIEGEHGVALDMAPHREAIDQIFRALIEKGMALEVNTSGLRQKIGRALPDLPFLRRYRELGGSLVTLGSDAHCAADLGKGIDEGMALLQQAGFTHLAVYRDREPMLLPLDLN